MLSPKVAVKVWKKETAVVFVPSRLQYAEAGIDWRLQNNDMVKIKPEGYRAPSEEEEMRLLERIKIDSFCGITVLGKQEVPAAARVEMEKNTKLQQENDQMRAELDDLRALLAESTKPKV